MSGVRAKAATGSAHDFPQIALAANPARLFPYTTLFGFAAGALSPTERDIGLRGNLGGLRELSHQLGGLAGGDFRLGGGPAFPLDEIGHTNPMNRFAGLLCIGFCLRNEPGGVLHRALSD